MTLTAATTEQMRAEGFPEGLQTAFKTTAEEMNCVILSRVPGGATTELIAAGHDLKGFFIKAKSCDWGPMTGFLCQVPAFNKKGVRGIKHNAEQNVNYHKKFGDRLRPPREGLDKQEPMTAAGQIKFIVKANKLLWQEAWKAPLLGTNQDPIETTRNFLKERPGEDPISRLSKLVSDDAKALTDSPDATKADERFQPRLSAVVNDLRVLVGDDSPFVPLKLTQKVFESFKEKQEKDHSEFIRTIGDITCGVASNGDSKNFVCFAYVIKKKEQEKQKEGGKRSQELYELYHGEIRVCKDETEQELEPFLDALRNDKGKSVVEAEGKQVLLPLKEEGIQLGDLWPDDDSAASVVKALKETWDSLKSDLNLKERPTAFTKTSVFYPIKGIQNYYPPFADDEAYLNAVTGDYDLFACWPMIPRGGLEELTRGDERTATRDTLFTKIPRNRYSLQTTASPNVLVEVIPTFKELEESERSHPSFGYISNDRVLRVAGMLNHIAAFLSASDTIRNVAFHGDEGGRPEIYEVEYAVAAFVPKSVMGAAGEDLMGAGVGEKDEQMFLITNHVELLTLINAVKDHCYVPLNFAWVYDLLTYEGDDVEDVKALLKEVFWTEAADSNHKILREAFSNLFGTQRPVTSEKKVELLADLKAAP